jgi:hypothetical protein
VHSNNGTKSTPSLSGDILGDWREEVIWPTSATPRCGSTRRRRHQHADLTLLHDLQYRVAIAWQNTAYNQPPHPSFFIGSRHEHTTPSRTSTSAATGVGSPTGPPGVACGRSPV